MTAASDILTAHRMAELLAEFQERATMCIPDDSRETFFAKGRAKGWSVARIERAWAAYQGQRGREDARLLNEAPPPPKPLAVGDRVRAKEGTWAFSNLPGEIIAIDGIEAWVRLEPGRRDTFALRNLERWSAASGGSYPGPSYCDR